MDKFIEDRLEKRGKNNDRSDDGKKDLLDVLLDMRSDEFTLTNIRGYLSVSLQLSLLAITPHKR